MRADARRNLQLLLRTASAVFAASGVDAPTREVAERAGVGIGTIYRHFPKRADLIVAVFRHEVDDCADAAPALAAQHRPRDALTAWIDRYVDLIVTKRGLATALHSGDAAYDGLPAYFESRLKPALEMLLTRAAEAGYVQKNVGAGDLLWAVASLCTPTRIGNPAPARRMVQLLIDGLGVGHDTRRDE